MSYISLLIVILLIALGISMTSSSLSTRSNTVDSENNGVTGVETQSPIDAAEEAKRLMEEQQ